MEWFQLAWKRYADFDGRSRRQEYWMFTLFQCLIVFAAYIVGLVLTVIGIGVVLIGLCFIYSLISLIPSLSVSVRRLHDTGKSGWFLLIGLIPFIGGLILIIMMAIDSDPGVNEFGPSPKYSVPAAPFSMLPVMPAWTAGHNSPRSEVQPQPASSLASDRSFGFCGMCGAKLQDASRFCGNCGAQI
jgi:uncharacterized membrane protein YhaH (DUF805 family)